MEDDAKYNQLKIAVQDLLCELRIDEKCLATMSNGYAPDYPGAVDCREDEGWKNPHCKIQIAVQKNIFMFKARLIGPERRHPTHRFFSG